MPVATPARPPFEVRGAVKELFHCKDEEVLIHGPAGTGKSRGALEKLHLVLHKYAGARGLLVRKTRSSLTNTGIVTFETEVLQPGEHVEFHTPTQSYRYPNKSSLVVGGLDDSQKIMSSQYDIALFQEATEGDEGDWQDITTRLRNGVVPYQQIIGDCNPAPPSHWLWRRCLAGITTQFKSLHEHNPRMYDIDKQEFNEYGKKYLAKLDRLTGARYQRLRLGNWVAAEGLVYDGWDPTKHIVERFEIPSHWPRYWGVDFGYNHPFVWKAYCEDPDGILYRYREVYRTNRTVADHCRTIRSLNEPRPKAVICDHDAEDRATLESELGVTTRPATKSITTGIQCVTDRLRFGGNGKAKIYYMKGSLVEADPNLSESKLPTCTEEEFDSYVWDDSTEKRKELPIKKYDHGLDVDRYICMHLDSRVRRKPHISVINI